MSYLYAVLGQIMNICYDLCHNYGVAIVLFTLFSKVVLIPVSVWTHLNSITMIKIQPDINFLKVKYYGQSDRIADEQAKIFKKEGYHPMASIVPLIIQLVLLMGVVKVIQEGIDNPAIDMSFGKVNLGKIPSENGIQLLHVPILAGISSFILCFAQNLSNVLQSEQTKWNKYGTMIFSVALSLYLGWFVPVGTAFYWICSNLMAVLQMYILNIIIKPNKYVDYERLNKSRKALKEIQGVGKQKKESIFSENKKRERQDYKRFFSVLNKHLVFYSESNGFYKYYKGIIEYILEHTNIIIHYITSDPNDAIFEMEKQNSQIHSYYIGENRLITLMMKMDADIVVMTMPDLENFHIKRSYIRNDIEYVYVPHGMGSINLTMRKGCIDHYDTIFCVGIHHENEVRENETVYHLPKKKIVELGYPLLDEIRAEYQKSKHTKALKKKILIAPSWQEENIIDSCLEEILENLKGKGYQIVVRPHPQEVRMKKEYMETLKRKYKIDGIEIQTDFSSNNPIMEADLLITDWSDICWEYAFTTYRPVLFIDTPMKIMNPEYQKLSTEPINLSLRNQIGKSLKLMQLNQISDVVEDLIEHKNEYYKQIDQLIREYIYHLGSSSEIGANYLIEAIQKKIEKKGKGVIK